MSLFSRREQFSWVPFPSCPPPGCPLWWDLLLCQHMCLLGQFIYKSPVTGPGRGPPSCNWWGLFFAETDILTPRGTQRPACLPMDQTQRLQLGGTLLSLVSSWRGQLARVPHLVRNKRLYWPLPFPLSVLSLALPILPVFLIPRSWTQQSGRRASAWAEDWRLVTSSWQRTRIPVGPSSSPPFSGSPGKSPVTPGCLQVAGDVCKATPFAPLFPPPPPPSFPLLLLKPLKTSKFLCLYRRFSERLYSCI